MQAQEHSPVAPFATLQTWLGVALSLVLVIGLCLLLPFERYVAWQQASGTQMFHAKWIYERLHFDRSPIEVAVLGSSRVEAGISPVVLSRELSRELGRPVSVANLSLVMPGRDFSAKVAEELVATHPEVRMVVLSDDGDVTNSHPMFAQTASLHELATAPLILNTKYFANLAQAPYRNLANWIQARVPARFGVSIKFEARDYAGTNLDRTLGYLLSDGTLVNGSQMQTAAELARFSQDALASQKQGLDRLRLVPREQVLAIDRQYTARIAELCRERGIVLTFVRLPYFGPEQPRGDPGQYASLGKVIDLDDLSDKPGLFQNGAHLNSYGANEASRRLAHAIAPLLAKRTQE